MPTASAASLTVAVPLESVTAEPKLLPSMTNWTVPVAVLGATVAVNVTVWLNVDGFAELVTVVVDVALLTVWPPARVPLLPLKLPSPL